MLQARREQTRTAHARAGCLPRPAGARARPAGRARGLGTAAPRRRLPRQSSPSHPPPPHRPVACPRPRRSLCIQITDSPSICCLSVHRASGKLRRAARALHSAAAGGAVSAGAAAPLAGLQPGGASVAKAAAPADCHTSRKSMHSPQCAAPSRIFWPAWLQGPHVQTLRRAPGARSPSSHYLAGRLCGRRVAAACAARRRARRASASSCVSIACRRLATLLARAARSRGVHTSRPSCSRATADYRDCSVTACRSAGQMWRVIINLATGQANSRPVSTAPGGLACACQLARMHACHALVRNNA